MTDLPVADGAVAPRVAVLDYGIGNLGPGARAFVDFLAANVVPALAGRSTG